MSPIWTVVILHSACVLLEQRTKRCPIAQAGCHKLLGWPLLPLPLLADLLFAGDRPWWSIQPVPLRGIPFGCLVAGTAPELVELELEQALLGTIPLYHSGHSNRLEASFGAELGNAFLCWAVLLLRGRPHLGLFP